MQWLRLSGNGLKIRVSLVQDESGQYDVKAPRTAIARYGALWAQWRQLTSEHSFCTTIYKDVGFEGRPGIRAAADQYRRVIEQSQNGKH